MDMVNLNRKTLILALLKISKLPLEIYVYKVIVIWLTKLDQSYYIFKLNISIKFMHMGDRHHKIGGTVSGFNTIAFCYHTPLQT